MPVKLPAPIRYALPGSCGLGELGWMRNIGGIGLVILLVVAATWPSHSHAAPDDARAIVARARQAGLRVLEGRRLTLVTDRPARAGDGVEDLPRIFDEAFAVWCRHFAVAADSLPDWHAIGCLMVDAERFRTAGLLPDSLPRFVNGFCADDRFWLLDQSNPAYRRHLLLHEGVHAFTLTVRRLATPPWYTEGIAEYLATHRLEKGAEGRERFVSTPLPDRPDDVPQLGRIEKIRGLRATGDEPSLAAVLATPAGDHHDIAAYAASWAATAFLARHPRYAAGFATVERGPLDTAFNDRLPTIPGWDAATAARDFDAFTADLDYGYDLDRCAIDWSAGRTPGLRETIAVDATRGWQNSGLALARGSRHALEVTGRFRIGELPAGDSAAPTILESEADGISLRWYRGRPLGRLLAAQWIEQPERGRPRFEILAEGSRADFTAVADGPLYFKINESPGDLGDNAGSLTVDLSPR